MRIMIASPIGSAKRLDRFIAEFPSISDGALELCPAHGTAYQRNMAVRAAYDESYFNKCRSYEDQEIALKINAGRIALVDRYIGTAPCLDIGIGSGEFIKKRCNTFGYDINPVAVEWLNARGLYCDDFASFGAFTFWDVIEHVARPEDYLSKIRPSAYLFVCLPIFLDLADIRQSRHYRPGEHLYYWTGKGFVAWMRLHGFELLEIQDYEITAGRDSILSFAFIRDNRDRQ